MRIYQRLPLSYLSFCCSCRRSLRPKQRCPSGPFPRFRARRASRRVAIRVWTYPVLVTNSGGAANTEAQHGSAGDNLGTSHSGDDHG